MEPHVATRSQLQQHIDNGMVIDDPEVGGVADAGAAKLLASSPWSWWAACGPEGLQRQMSLEADHNGCVERGVTEETGIQ